MRRKTADGVQHVQALYQDHRCGFAPSLYKHTVVCTRRRNPFAIKSFGSAWPHVVSQQHEKAKLIISDYSWLVVRGSWFKALGCGPPEP